MFKILGLFIVFLSSVSIGFLKSYNANKEIENSEKTLKELKIFAQKVKLGEKNLKEILSENLRENVYKNSAQNERKILEELFENFGTKNKAAEYERVLIFIERFEIILEEKKKKEKPLIKLYKTLGVLIGAFVCIFLI